MSRRTNYLLLKRRTFPPEGGHMVSLTVCDHNIAVRLNTSILPKNLLFLCQKKKKN